MPDPHADDPLLKLDPLRPFRWLFLDLNSYFASVEQQEDPALRGRPVAVGESGMHRWMEVTACTPGGLRLGHRLARRFRQRAFVLLRRKRPALLVMAA